MSIGRARGVAVQDGAEPAMIEDVLGRMRRNERDEQHDFEDASW